MSEYNRKGKNNNEQNNNREKNLNEQNINSNSNESNSNQPSLNKQNLNQQNLNQQNPNQSNTNHLNTNQQNPNKPNTNQPNTNQPNKSKENQLKTNQLKGNLGQLKTSSNNIMNKLTLNCIYKMYNNLFNNFGCIFLIDNYKRNIDHYNYLLSQLNKNTSNKLKNLFDIDKKKDCNIIINNINNLSKYISYINNNKINIKNKLENSNTNINDSITIEDLNKWYYTLFEKLGWMIISHSNQDIDRIKNYYNSLSKIYSVINNKIYLYNNNNIYKDRINDYKIMLNNIILLRNHVKIYMLSS